MKRKRKKKNEQNSGKTLLRKESKQQLTERIIVWYRCDVIWKTIPQTYRDNLMIKNNIIRYGSVKKPRTSLTTPPHPMSSGWLVWLARSSGSSKTWWRGPGQRAAARVSGTKDALHRACARACTPHAHNKNLSINQSPSASASVICCLGAHLMEFPPIAETHVAHSSPSPRGQTRICGAENNFRTVRFTAGFKEMPKSAPRPTKSPSYALRKPGNIQDLYD